MTLGIAGAAADNSATNTQEIAVDCDGQVPVACIILASRATIDNTAADGAMRSIGVTDGTNVRLAAFMAEDNVVASTADSARSMSDVQIVQILNTTTGAVLYAATFGGFSNDLVRIEWGAAPIATAYLIQVFAFYGSNCSATTGHISASTTQGGTATVSGLSFRPNIVIFFGGEFGFATGVNAHGRQHFGAATFDESNNVTGQWFMSLGDRERTASGVTANASVLRDDAIGCRYTISGSSIAGPITLLSQSSVTSGASDGFTITTDEPASPSAMINGYLALRYEGQEALAFIPGVTNLDTSALGEYAITNLGWNPSAVLAVSTRNSILNNYFDDGGHSDSIGGASSRGGQRCMAVQLEDRTSPTDTRSFVRNQFLGETLRDDGAALYSYGVSDFNNQQGFEVEVFNASTTKYFTAFLAIKAPEEILTNDVETVSIGDDFGAPITSFAGMLEVSETVSVSDEALLFISVFETTEGVTIADAAQLADVTATLTESVIVNDAHRFTGEGVGAIVDETVVVSDAFASVPGTLLEVSEGVSIGDDVDFGAGAIQMKVGAGRGRTVEARSLLGTTVQSSSRKGSTVESQ